MHMLKQVRRDVNNSWETTVVGKVDRVHLWQNFVFMSFVFYLFFNIPI